MSYRLTLADFQPFGRPLRLAAEAHYRFLRESGDLDASDSETTIMSLAVVWPSAPKPIYKWLGEMRDFKGPMQLNALTFTDGRIAFFILNDGKNNTLSSPDPRLVYDLSAQLTEASREDEAMSKLVHLISLKSDDRRLS